MPSAARSLTASPVCRSSGKLHNLTPLRLVGGSDVDVPLSGAPFAGSAAAPPAGQEGGTTPVWSAFQRWCAIQHAQMGVEDDETSNRLHAEFRAAETALRQSPVSTPRDLAAKAYAALHVVDYFPADTSPVLLGDECEPFTQAVVADILAAYPEILALVMGDAA